MLSYICPRWCRTDIGEGTATLPDGTIGVSELGCWKDEQVPDDFIIRIRLGAYEPTLTGGIIHVQKLDEIGVDVIDVSYGTDGDSDPYCPESWNKYADEGRSSVVNLD